MIVNIALQKPEHKQQKKSHQNFSFQFWIGEIEYNNNNIAFFPKQVGVG